MEPKSTVFRGHDLAPEDLSSHGRAMRAIARSVLGDGHAADDVVQETWLACLKRPGALPERASAWLGTVTRRMALRLSRGEGRRHGREERAAISERIEAVQQRTLEREEGMRAVTSAVLALDEPYKTALLLRYYEERAPAEIAAELDLPLATVKSRLKRGLELMRRRLAADFGSEERSRHALAVLAGLPVPSLLPQPRGIEPAAGPGLATIGALMVSFKLLGTLVAVVVGGSALLWWSQDETTALEEIPAALVAHAPGQAPESDEPLLAPEEHVDSEPRREALSASISPDVRREAVPSEKGFPYRIAGAVRDQSSLPLAGARVYLGPHRFPLNQVAITDENGRFAFSFRGRRPSFDAVFTVAKGGQELGLLEVPLASGGKLMVDVDLETPMPSNIAAVLTFVQDDLGAVHVEGEAREPLEKIHYASASWTLVGSSGPLGRAPHALRHADGNTVLLDPGPVQGCPRARPEEEELFFEPVGEYVSIRGRLAPPESVLPVIQFALAAEEPEEPEPIEPDTARVHGVVRDASGNPAANVTIDWGRPGAGSTGRTTSDEAGRFGLMGVAPGEVRLRVGGGELGRALERFTLVAGQELDWNPLLERGDEVSGRVLLEEHAVPTTRVDLVSAHAGFFWSATTITNEDGRFAFANVPSGTFELHVYCTGVANPEGVFPSRVLRSVFPGSDLGDVVLGARDFVLHEISVAVLHEDDTPLGGAEVRVWQQESGRGLFAEEPDKDGRLTLAGLPRGSYRIEVGGPLGRRDLGSIWVDEDMDLGIERFAPAGLAQVYAGVESDGQGEEGATEPSLTLWSAHPDLLGLALSRERLSTDPLGLRPGEHLLRVDAGGPKALETNLTVRSGATTGFTLERGPKGEPELRAGMAPGRFLEQAAHEADRASCSSCHVGAR